MGRSPAGSPSDGPSAPPSAGPTCPPDDPRSISEDVFTAPPAPLSLSRTLDDEHAVTAEIGPEGGSIDAAGADGTTNTLTVPADALAFTEWITVLPIPALEGFPNETPPDEILGVDLAPNGLELGVPATLSIEAASALPETDIVALAYVGEGTDTGFHTGSTRPAPPPRSRSITSAAAIRSCRRSPPFIGGERPLVI